MKKEDGAREGKGSKLPMENEILLHVEGMRGRKCENKIVSRIAMMPGVELVQANADQGTVSVTGGDLDQLQIVDIVESLGYSSLH